MQATAKWLVGAAASVLAVLVAGLRLSSAAKIAAQGMFDLWIIAALCALPILAVAAIMILSARVLIHPGWTLNVIAHQEIDLERWQKHWLSKALDGNRGFLLPDLDRAGVVDQPDSLGAAITAAANQPVLRPARLYRHHQQLLGAWFELMERGHTAVHDDLLDENAHSLIYYSARDSQDIELLRQRLATTATAAGRIAHVANTLDVRRRYRRLITFQLPLLTTVTVLAVLGLAWFTTSHSEVPVTTPLQVDIQFVGTPDALIQNQLPPACAGLTIHGVAINGTLTKPTVSSISNTHCQLNQHELSATVAIIIPTAPQQ